MAIEVLKNAYVLVNAVNLSNRVREVIIDDGFAEVDTTKMTDTADDVEAGMRRWTITVKFLQDYAAASVHQTLRSLIGAKTSITVRKDGGTVGPTNPQWSSTSAFLPSYSPLQASVGDKQEITVTFKNGGAVLTYAEA